VTDPQVAKVLGVRNEWLYHRIKTGKLDVKLDPNKKLYLIPNFSDALGRIRQVKDEA